MSAYHSVQRGGRRGEIEREKESERAQSRVEKTKDTGKQFGRVYTGRILQRRERWSEKEKSEGKKMGEH